VHTCSCWLPSPAGSVPPQTTILQLTFIKERKVDHTNKKRKERKVRKHKTNDVLMHVKMTGHNEVSHLKYAHIKTDLSPQECKLMKTSQVNKSCRYESLALLKPSLPIFLHKQLSQKSHKGSVGCVLHKLHAAKLLFKISKHNW